MEYNAKTRVEDLKKKLGDNNDIVIRKVLLGESPIFLIFLEEITDSVMINENVINPLLELPKDSQPNFNTIQIELNYINQTEVLTKESDIIDKFFLGNVLIFLDNEEQVIALNVAKYEQRPVMEPPTSAVIKGPREGFTESNKTNMSLIRKRLLTESLKVEDVTVGRRTRTNVKVVYLEDVADKKIVRKILQKLNKIDIDGIIDSYYVVKFLEERPFSIFKQVGANEKPDITVSKILEGRVAILVDGSPMVLTLPFMLLEDIQNSNNYYSQSLRATGLRILALFSIFISIVVPGFYVALQLYHYKLLPLKFLISIMNNTQNLPLNPFLEVLFILVLFEILYEASIKMPKYIGMALSIVGALILGDTAVQAGLVSPPGVMIVALSSITVYVTPDLSSEIFILRFVFILLGGMLGFLGILLGTVVILIYLLDFDNYGTPYLAPFAPYVKSDQKDFIFKAPLPALKTRPKSFPNKNRKRQG